MTVEDKFVDVLGNGKERAFKCNTLHVVSCR